jgi:protein-S-isoprenylcysteine O-methyltransferase Ste14
MIWVQIVIFGLGSTFLAVYSWPSLRDHRSHGFYRFFGWMYILAVIALNLPSWFERPLAIQQLISWTLLVGSIRLALHGFRLLKRIGQPEGEFERTTRLVTAGAYRYIRHPLYASLLLLDWGAFLKDPSWAGAALALAASLFLYLTARVEEQENLARFGEAYREYMQRTKMFIPFLL